MQILRVPICMILVIHFYGKKYKMRMKFAYLWLVVSRMLKPTQLNQFYCSIFLLLWQCTTRSA